MFPSPPPISRSIPVQSNSSCFSSCLSSPWKLRYFLNFVFGYTTTLPLTSTGGTASSVRICKLSENMQNYGEVVNVGICYVITPLTNGIAEWPRENDIIIKTSAHPYHHAYWWWTKTPWNWLTVKKCSFRRWKALTKNIHGRPIIHSENETKTKIQSNLLITGTKYIQFNGNE